MTGKKRGRARGRTGAATPPKTGERHPQYTTSDQYPASTPIYVGNRVIGHVAGDVFEKTIRGSAHMLRRPRAIAFDVSTLDDAEAAGATSVAITDSETGRVYRAPLSLIRARGFAVNRGHGQQLGVIISDFNRPAETRPDVVQLSLF